MRATVSVIQGGKVTIPATIRDELDLDNGDTIEIDVQLVNGHSNGGGDGE